MTSTANEEMRLGKNSHITIRYDLIRNEGLPLSKVTAKDIPRGFDAYDVCRSKDVSLNYTGPAPVVRN